MNKRFNFRRARGAVALALVAFVVAGLLFRIGSGTPSAFGIDQIAAVCPLGALEALFGAKEFMPHPIILLAAMVVLVVVFGKAFCAWGCPVPWLQRFFRPKKKASGGKTSVGGQKSELCAVSSLEKNESEEEKPQNKTTRGETEALRVENDATSEKIECISRDFDHEGEVLPSDGDSRTASGASPACSSCGGACKLAPLGGERDGVQLDARHAVLAGTLASAAVFGFPVFCLVCPVGLTFATLIGLWHLFQFNEPSWALVVFPIILVLELTVLRKWCSKICPIVALTSLIANANRTLRPRVDQSKCLRGEGIDCHSCVDACPEKLDPHSGHIPECSKCGACIEVCPAKAIKIKLLK